MKTNRHVHLVGICGTAMASLAGMLKQRGFKVTGSDAAAYPPMSDFLAGLGIPVAQPYAEANLQPHPDLVVVGNAISRGNVELEYLLDHRIRFCSLPQILHEEFLRGREVIAIAGTHGKTTTTSMLAWIFQSAGKRPAFLVGGIAENFGSSFALGDGGHFIIEGDEYDTAFFDKGPKFLHYFPDSVILTSVEFDHADIYRDLDAVKTAFKRLVNLVPRRGRIVAYQGNGNVTECVAKALAPVERYGTAGNAAWQITNLLQDTQRTRWSVLHAGRHWADFEFALAGEYNVLNATAAAAMASAYGITIEQIAAALKSFKSVKRRLEVRAEVNGITIIDDFAHHPTAIAETIKALRARYPGRRLWAILEPRSNTLRRNVLQNELAQSLATADEVVVARVFRPEAIPESECLDLTAVIARINHSGKRARAIPDADAIVAQIGGELRRGDVVVILSNGGFGGIYEKLPRRLQAAAPAAAPAHS
ncbi:MAG TPA: UDP-N-acetylmuramate:L-alanyl-gamma-D-glutamyl-meso-diaminopimelate ligase [Terriglobales bacterium]|nr:UDP-N-acetylmuramate:L-alanyl-gamma-D-glutamyl-meso-diaminopimelate ligase [Terriglobales bacterium]